MLCFFLDVITRQWFLAENVALKNYCSLGVTMRAVCAFMFLKNLVFSTTVDRENNPTGSVYPCIVILNCQLKNK